MKSQVFPKNSIIILYLLSSYSVFLFSQDEILKYTREDGLFETITALWLLVSSIVYFITFFRDKNGNALLFIRTNKNFFFLLLAVMFFFGFGEEISWGQRIFKWQSLDWFNQYNNQKETNIHNLAIFQRILNFEHLSTYFWVTYCLIIPFVYKKSLAFAAWSDKINLPIIPIRLGTFFLLNYVIFIILKLSFRHSLQHSVVEVKESCLGFLFMISSIGFLLNGKR